MLWMCRMSLVGVLLLAQMTWAARAAVRTCGAQIATSIVTAPSEQEGKKRALDEWRARAAVLGPGFDGWHVASQKTLKCFAKAGQFECMAVGNPCIIQQNPKHRPAGADGKGQPL